MYISGITLFVKEDGQNGARLNNALLMLINVGNGDQRKNPETFRGNKKNTDALVSALYALCALARRMIGRREEAAFLKWKSYIS